MGVEEVLNELAANGVDLEKTLHRFLENKDLYVKFLKKFLDDPNYAQMQEDVKAKDYVKLLESSHALKGLSGNLGLDPMFEKLSKMVSDIRANDYSDIENLNVAIKEYYDLYVGIISKLA